MTNPEKEKKQGKPKLGAKWILKLVKNEKNDPIRITTWKEKFSYGLIKWKFEYFCSWIWIINITFLKIKR
mgnify:CR=1 FL=1